MSFALCLSIAGCARTARVPQYRAQIADVTAPRAQAALPAPVDASVKPWSIGQWAIYKTVAGDEIGYERFDVVAIDGCGTWVRLLVQTTTARSSTSVCVRTEADGRKLVAYVVDKLGGGQVVVGDFRAQPRPTRRLQLFLPLPATPGSTSESLDVPYGHVDGATRVELPESTSWSHPAVPLAGTVKEQWRDGTTRELVAFGNHNEESIVPDIAASAETKPPSTASRLWAAGGAGFGVARGYRHEDSNGSSTLRLRAGGILAPSLDLMTEVVRVSSESSDQLSKQDSTVMLLGARWRPLVRARTQVLRDLHLRAGVGASFLDRTMMGVSSEEQALAGSVGVVLVARITQSVYFAVDLGDDVQVSSAGTRHNLLATSMLELHWDRN